MPNMTTYYNSHLLFSGIPVYFSYKNACATNRLRRMSQRLPKVSCPAPFLLRLNILPYRYHLMFQDMFLTDSVADNLSNYFPFFSKIFYRFFTTIKIFCFGFWQLQKFFVSFFWQLHIVYNSCIQRSVLTDPGLVEGAAGADPLWCGCLLLLATTEPTDDVMIRHVVQLLLS